MKTEKFKSDKWEAVKDLYQWRKGTRASEAYTRLADGDDSLATDEEKAVFQEWKEHANEEVYFTLRHFRPDETR